MLLEAARSEEGARDDVPCRGLGTASPRRAAHPCLCQFFLRLAFALKMGYNIFANFLFFPDENTQFIRLYW